MPRTLVVGAGAAGCVLAARLSESPDDEVTLVEAGPDYPDLGALPTDLVDGTRNAMTSHDYGYRHRPTARGFTMPYPRGRVVGGSSAVNTCIAIRGQRYDYDEWRDLGLPEWSFEACLPAFRRLETDLDFPDAPYHGDRGPIRIRRHRPEELAPFQASFLEAADQLGFARCADTNDPDGTGADPHAMNKIDGVRQSAARGYLDARVRARPNLRIESRLAVDRVRFVGSRAVGVEGRRDGRPVSLDADRVLLAGGALETPRLLLASGIGPEAELARLGVPCLVASPGVGAELLDHPGIAIFLLPKVPLVRPGDPLIQAVLRYHPARGRRNEMQIQAGSFVPAFLDLPLVSLMSSLGKPSSRAGRLRFDDLSPGARPRIDTHFLEHPDDLDKALEAVEHFALLASCPAIAKVARPLLPGPRGLRDRAAITRWLHRQVGSGYHPCGTAKMGAATDPLAVCDGRGAVRGTEGLHVVDASLMPTVPTANTHLPTLMMAEHLAEMLRHGPLGGSPR